MTIMKPAESVEFLAPYQTPSCKILSVRTDGNMCQSNFMNIQDIEYDGEELSC